MTQLLIAKSRISFFLISVPLSSVFSVVLGMILDVVDRGGEYCYIGVELIPKLKKNLY